MSQLIPISIVIPTYRREGVLIETLERLLAMEYCAEEMVIVDQTALHEAKTEEVLRELSDKGRVVWIRLPRPSVPHAMNTGLTRAMHDVVLFLDDDIIPGSGLVQAHLTAHLETSATLVAGRVIQPWQEGKDYSAEETFHFAALKPRWIDAFMGGNFSVRRNVAVELGGFDENFVGAAYNFEAEFAYRLRSAGHRIYYSPEASIRHLKVQEGGTRTYGEHLMTCRPYHAVGAYYHAFRTWAGMKSLSMAFTRPFKAIATRHHLLHPWWIPATLISEVSGFFWAVLLCIRGPRYIRRQEG